MMDVESRTLSASPISVRMGDCVSDSRPTSSTRIALRIKQLEEERAIQQREWEFERKAIERERNVIQEKYRLLQEQLSKRRNTTKYSYSTENDIARIDNIQRGTSDGNKPLPEVNKSSCNELVAALSSNQQDLQPSRPTVRSARNDASTDRPHSNGIQQRCSRAFSRQVQERQELSIGSNIETIGYYVTPCMPVKTLPDSNYSKSTVGHIIAMYANIELCRFVLDDSHPQFQIVSQNQEKCILVKVKDSLENFLCDVDENRLTVSYPMFNANKLISHHANYGFTISKKYNPNKQRESLSCSKLVNIQLNPDTGQRMKEIITLAIPCSKICSFALTGYQNSMLQPKINKFSLKNGGKDFFIELPSTIVDLSGIAKHTTTVIPLEASGSLVFCVLWSVVCDSASSCTERKIGTTSYTTMSTSSTTNVSI